MYSILSLDTNINSKRRLKTWKIGTTLSITKR